MGGLFVNSFNSFIPLTPNTFFYFYSTRIFARCFRHHVISPNPGPRLSPPFPFQRLRGPRTSGNNLPCALWPRLEWLKFFILWFAATFYPVPSSRAEKQHRAFLAHVISQAVLRKLREEGGAKDVVAKAETYQVRWLIEVTTKEVLHTHLNLIKARWGHEWWPARGGFSFRNKTLSKGLSTYTLFFHKSVFPASKKLQIRKLRVKIYRVPGPEPSTGTNTFFRKKKQGTQTFFKLKKGNTFVFQKQ